MKRRRLYRNRIIAFLLCGMLIAGLLPITANAETDTLGNVATCDVDGDAATDTGADKGGDKGTAGATSEAAGEATGDTATDAAVDTVQGSAGDPQDVSENDIDNDTEKDTEKNTEKDTSKDAKESLDTVEDSASADTLKSASGEDDDYDGDVSWYNETASEYILYDAEDLLGLASLVNAGNSFEGKTVSLGKNISLEELDEEWIPIGYNQSTPYKGNFCGNGYKITDMQVSVADHGGLFGYLYGAYVSDLTVEGSMIITGSNGGGIAGQASSSTVIENCSSSVNISASSTSAVLNIGGIVGYLSIHSTINGCTNYGTINCRSVNSRSIGGIAGGVLSTGISGCDNYGNVTGGYNIGGIAGTAGDAYDTPNSCVIENCRNTGRIASCLTENESSTSMAGGIVGILEETGTITACANQGTVNGGRTCGTGGIAGKLLGTITYSYNIGEVSNSNSSANASLGGLAGIMAVGDSGSAEIRYSYNAGTVQPGEDFAALTVGNLAGSRASGTSMWKTYGLEDDSQSLIGGDGSAEGAEGKTAEAFKDAAFLTEINQAAYAIFVADSSTDPMNQGYPVLFWQKSSDTACTVTIAETTNGTIEASETTVPYGSYIELTAYPVAGYKLNNYTVNGVSTTSAKILVTQDITVGAKFVKASSGTLVFPKSDDYTLQVSKTGIIYQDGTYQTVTDLPVSDGDKVYEGDKLYITVDFTAEPEDTSKEYDPEITSTNLKASTYGEYYQVTGSSGGKVTFSVSLKEVLKTWESLADTEWYNTEDTVFTLTTASQLAGLSLLVRDGVDDFSGKTVELGNDISLADPKGGVREWLPIGYADYSTANGSGEWFNQKYYRAFSGTFAGNSHTISGLYMSEYCASEKYRGLFASVYYGVIQDVTVEGELRYAKSYNADMSLEGGIAALIYGSQITRCVSQVNIYNTVSSDTAYLTKKGCGGIVGYMMENSIVSQCTYEGELVSQTVTYPFVGGIAGVSSDGSSIEYCTNKGDIKANTNYVYAGGIAGISYSTVYGCVNYGTITSELRNVAMASNMLQADSIGGIVGCGASVAACVNKGDVQGGTNSAIVGGIAGKITGTYTDGAYVGSIDSCYNTGNISSEYDGEYAGASDTGTTYTLEIGGIVGYLQEGYDITITNCYNSGKIVLPETVSENISVLSGSICGKIGNKQYDDVFENCYYLFRTSDYAAHQMELCDGISMFYAADMTEADSGFAEMLNHGGYEYFCEDDKGANNGYPLLFFEQVIGIQIMKQPEQTTYTAFDTFVPAGMEVAVVYSNGDTATIGDYSYSKEPLTVDTEQVTITYQDGGGTTRKASVPVTVVPYDLTGKTVSVTLDQTSYDYADGAFVIPVIQSAADDMGREMEEYTDYEVTYEKNQEVGTATLILTGTGNYTGTTSAEFEIQRRTIQGMTATLSKTSYTYNGKACCPTVTIDGLEEGKDYTVSYQNNQVAGTAKAVITGIGNYTGEITETFTIKKAAQSITGVSGSYSKAYSTSGMTLKATAKGKISYSSGNTKVAKINATNGKITYVGAGTATITIKAAATSGYNAATKTVKLTVTRASQKITAKKSIASYTASALSKKAASFSIGAKTSGNGKLTYKVSSTPSGASKYITVSSTGKVTLKKGAKKGTYKILVTAAKTNQYNKSTKYITIQVK